MRGAVVLVAVLAVGLVHGLGLLRRETVVELPTRPGVTERLIFISPDRPSAAVILFAGGQGGLQISSDGRLGWGETNFLIRSRQLFAGRGLAVVVLDAPSDRQRPPYLGGFRQSPQHVADVEAVIAWLRARLDVPVWLVGTSLGTFSVAYVGANAQLPPDGVVLISTTLTHDRMAPVPTLPLEDLEMPVLVVHHEDDECRHSSIADLPDLMASLGTRAEREVVTFTGGTTTGDPCESDAHHGFAGQEAEVVRAIAEFISRHAP
jgi:alpha/beta superfamily hydrolase